MKKVRNTLFYPLLFLSMILIAVAGFMAHYDTRRAIAGTEIQENQQTSLKLTVATEGPMVRFSWNGDPGYGDYNLLFSLHYGEIADEFHELYIGNETEATLDFDSTDIFDIFPGLRDFETIENGISFYVAVEAYDEQGKSQESNMEYVMVGYDKQLLGEEQVLLGSEATRSEVSDASIDETSRYTLTVSPSSHSLALGETKAFTPSGGTGFYSATSSNTAVATVKMNSWGKYGVITGKSKGSAKIEILDISRSNADEYDGIGAHASAGGFTSLELNVLQSHTIGTYACCEVTKIVIPVISTSIADHTYVKGTNSNGGTVAWGCFGGSSGGKLLSYTDTSGKIDLSTIEFMADKSPCKWPKETLYGIVGVCHQLSNRGLYYTNKTVWMASKYALSLAAYGTYGRTWSAYDKFSLDNCLSAAPEWKGGAFRSENKEISIYQKYYGPSQNSANNSEVRSETSLRSQWLSYMDELFSWFITERLGQNFPKAKVERLIAIRREWDNKKELVDNKISKGYFVGAEAIEQQNLIFNHLADDFKKVLNSSEYEKLVGLEYNTKVDITEIWPK